MVTWPFLLVVIQSLLLLKIQGNQIPVVNYYDPNRIFFPLREPQPIYAPPEPTPDPGPFKDPGPEYPEAEGFPCGYILDIGLIEKIQSADDVVLQKFASAALGLDELPQEIIDEIKGTPAEKLQEDFRTGVYGGPDGCDDNVQIDDVNPEKVGPNLKYQGFKTLDEETGLVSVGDLRGPAKPINAYPLYPQDGGQGAPLDDLADPDADVPPPVEDNNMPLLNNAQFGALQAGRKIQLSEDQIALLKQRMAYKNGRR